MIGYGGFGMANAMFTIVPIFIGVVFVLILAGIAVQAVRGAAQWKRNNDAPVLTVEAEVAAKRMDVRTYRHGGTEHSRRHASSRTYYYATFQVESGDRMELSVSGREYGMLAEGDIGKLTFQGTRYLSFERV